MIKVLYLPLNSPEIVQTGMYDAFRDAGVDLRIFDFANVPAARRALITEAKVFEPHLIHMQLQFMNIIDAETLREIKRVLPNTIITNWTGDIRQNVPNSFVEIGKAIDLSLISSVGQLPAYKAAIGNNVQYWQIGVDPKRFFPQNRQSFVWDAVFAASNHTSSRFPGHSQREQTAISLKNELRDRFGLFGYGWKGHLRASYVNYYEMNNVYAQSLSCISVSNFNEVSHYFSDRLLLSLASGRPVIALKFPGWESYFTDGKDIIIANTVPEISGKIKWLKHNPVAANQIGAAGAAKVFAEHTCQSRVAELLDKVGL